MTRYFIQLKARPMTFRVSYGLAVAVLSLGSGAIASPTELSCAGQEGPGSVSISLDENAGTASLSDDDGLGKTGTSRADFSPTEVHFHDGRTAKFSINWVIERAD